MIDYNNRLWKKMIKSKHKVFRIHPSLRNVQPNQVLRTRYGFLI